MEDGTHLGVHHKYIQKGLNCFDHVPKKINFGGKLNFALVTAHQWDYKQKTPELHRQLKVRIASFRTLLNHGYSTAPSSLKNTISVGIFNVNFCTFSACKF